MLVGALLATGQEAKATTNGAQCASNEAPTSGSDNKPCLFWTNTATTVTVTLYRGTGSKKYEDGWKYELTGDQSVPCTTVTGDSVTVQNLQPDSHYQFSASETCSGPPSQFKFIPHMEDSGTMAVRTKSSPKVEASDYTATTIKLTISNYTNNTAWYYKRTTPSSSTCASAGTGTTSTVTGLTANTAYAFTAYSDSDCGTSLGAVKDSLTQATTLRTLRAKMSTPRVSPLNKKLYVEWDARTGADGYDVEWKSGTQSWGNTNRYGSPTTSGTTYLTIPDTSNDDDMSNGTEYTVRIRSKYSAASQFSEWSDGVKATPNKEKLRASNIGTTGARLNIDNYRIDPDDELYDDNNWWYKYTEPAGGTCSSTNNSTGEAKLYVDLSNLSSGTTYTFQAYKNLDCSSTLGDPVTFITRNPPPPAPTPRLSTSAVTETTATLATANYWGSWYYKRTQPTEGDHPYGTCSAAVTGTSVNLTGLRADTSYTFTAYSDKDCTSFIDSYSFTTAAPPPAVNLSTLSLTLTEGTTDSYTVRLNSQPTDTVTVALESSDTTVATVSPTTLSFKPSNWDQTQNVTVTGLDNAVDGQDRAITISHNPSGGDYDSLDPVPLAVSVTDDDARGVSLSTSSLTLTEGTTDTYTVVLNSQPTDTVTVALESSDATVATVSPTTLSFKPSNWDQTQNVTVTGLDNAVDGQDRAITISHNPSGGDYDSLDPVPLALTVTDDDARGVSLSTSSLTLTEGTTDSYTVVLNSQPTDTVTVALESSDATVATVSPTTLSFKPSNWDQTQNVTVTGLDNAVDGQDRAITISHNPSGGDYDSLDPVPLALTVTDDDARGVSLSTSSLTLTEGTTDSYTVVLNSQPTDTVTVALESSDTTVATVSPTTLSFKPSNWDQTQNVTVTGTKDADTQDAVITIRHDPSGGDYGGLSGPQLTVTVEDLGPLVSQRVNQVVQDVVPDVNRAVTAHTTHAVANRVGQVVQGALPLSGTQISWGDLPTTAQGAMALARRWTEGETISVAALLDNTSFNTSFPPQSQGSATAMTDGNASSPWGVWGAVDYGQFASGEDQSITEWDAALLTALLGADRMVNDNLLTGAALAWSSSSFDYQTRSSGELAAGKGEGRLQLLGIHPYIGWRFDGGNSLWASVGYGWGDLTIDDDDDVETSTDLKQWSLATGASGILYQSNNGEPAAASNQLLWKTDAWFSSLHVAGNDVLHDDQQQAYRLRLGVEGNRSISLDNHSLLTPSLGLFYRYEGGDGATGSGLDLAAALRYDNPNGLQLEGRGRTLLLHSEGLKDWGISGLLRYSPRGNDGFSLSLSPKWGRTDSPGLQQLWSNHQDQLSTTGDVSSALLLDAELRSPKLTMGSYSLTPALGFQLSPDIWTTRLGTALHLHDSLNLQLHLSRQQPDAGHANHSLGLNLQMDF